MGFWQNIKQFFAEGFEIISMIPSSLSDKPDAWEWSISKFEAQDRFKPPPNGAIVFTGSSSITFWKTLEQDMAPLPVINRGFGGSKIHQVAYYVDRIVIPYRPRAVVLFAGTNDIAGEFVWHRHEAEDELFLVVKGRLLIRLRDRDMWLDEGEFVVIPKWVEHLPIAEDEVQVLLLEPKSTLNTGNVQNERTVSGLEWI